VIRIDWVVATVRAMTDFHAKWRMLFARDASPGSTERSLDLTTQNGRKNMDYVEFVKNSYKI
jgi:hypothetical protein